MAKGLANAIAVELAARGLGTLYGNPAADVFVHEEPVEPDDVIVVFEVPGGSFPQQLAEEHLITVRVRDRDPERAEERLRSVQRELHETAGLFGGIPVAFVRATAPAAPLGRDDAGPRGGRWRWTQTFRVLARVNFDFV